MKCQSCGKNNASIHITKIVNGKIEEKHLCDNCAQIGDELDLDLPFSFQKLFTSLISSMQEDSQEAKEIKDVTCPQCGLTYNEFLEGGKFGCINCFKAFEDDVNSLLKGIHGHSEHMGKIPSRVNSKNLDRIEMESLKEELQQSINKEEFERAAVLRDEIRVIEKKLENSKE